LGGDLKTGFPKLSSAVNRHTPKVGVFMGGAPIKNWGSLFYGGSGSALGQWIQIKTSRLSEEVRGGGKKDESSYSFAQRGSSLRAQGKGGNF